MSMARCFLAFQQKHFRKTKYFQSPGFKFTWAVVGLVKGSLLVVAGREDVVLGRGAERLSQGRRESNRGSPTWKGGNTGPSLQN